MAHLFKVKTTKSLPSNAEIVVRNGQRCLKTKRSGKVAFLPLTNCGARYTQESRKWYVQYQDASGRWLRVPGYADKESTQQLAAELERNSERLQSGLADPFGEARATPLTRHLADYKQHLKGKANSPKHIELTFRRITRLLEECKFQTWDDISGSRIMDWLSLEREQNRIGLATTNHYLAAIKAFALWMVKDGRAPSNPLLYLQALNTATDTRRKRRALSASEFAALIAAAERGAAIQGVSGRDRAMLYVLAAWTGFRRGELASLTGRSLNLTGDVATISVQASYSKRRRDDQVPLHPAVVERLREWLRDRTQSIDAPLFDLRTKAGELRRTSKMMRLDLQAARQSWLQAAADSPEERRRREESDYLKYHSEAGLYADFHANRHTFISNLAKAGVSPKVAQTIARHSDVNLTMNVYSHVGIGEQDAAIRSLASPPAHIARDQRNPGEKAEKFAHRFAQTSDARGRRMASGVRADQHGHPRDENANPKRAKQLVILCHAVSPDDSNSGGGIRTPDTRIMILRAENCNPLRAADLGQPPLARCTYCCTQVELSHELAALICNWPTLSDRRRQALSALANVDF